jgi:hypothetical protein
MLVSRRQFLGGLATAGAIASLPSASFSIDSVAVINEKIYPDASE